MRVAPAAVMFVLVPMASASAQHRPAPTYLERYHEVMNLTPMAGQVAAVNHLVLRRDVGQITLERGALYLLSPVGGRTVGAVFRGVGRFTFAPSLPTEQAELRRFAGSPALDDTTTEVILLFADSTAEELRGLAFGQAARLRVIQEDVPADFLMFVLVSVDLGGNRFAHFRVKVQGAQTEWVSPLVPAQPKGLRFNELQSVLAEVKMERW